MKTKLLFLFIKFFFKRRFLCSSGYPRTHSVVQAGLELRDLSISASLMVGIKGMYPLPPSPGSKLLYNYNYFREKNEKNAKLQFSFNNKKKDYHK